MPILSTLNDDEKLDLIGRLTQSMRSKNKTKTGNPDIRTCFSGDWGNGKTAIQIAEELRNERNFRERNNNIEW